MVMVNFAPLLCIYYVIFLGVIGYKCYASSMNIFRYFMIVIIIIILIIMITTTTIIIINI